MKRQQLIQAIETIQKALVEQFHDLENASFEIKPEGIMLCGAESEVIRENATPDQALAEIGL